MAILKGKKKDKSANQQCDEGRVNYFDFRISWPEKKNNGDTPKQVVQRQQKSKGL